MTDLRLDVPILAQEKSMCCWHTSAMMIWLYWQGKSGRQGPMYTIVPVYNDNSGLSVSAQTFITLASNTGMMRLPSKNTYSNDDLYNLLNANGPLWCAGLWYGFGHVIVLTGISNGQIYLNDPDGGKRKTGTLAWFNEKLLNGLDGCMMAKDPKAY